VGFCSFGQQQSVLRRHDDDDDNDNINNNNNYNVNYFLFIEINLLYARIILKWIFRQWDWDTWTGTHGLD